MILSSTQTLEILLAGAIATSNSPVVVDYVDVDTITLTPGTAASLTSGVSPVTFCAAPAGSTKRKVNEICVANIDTAAITATVRLNDSGTTYDIIKVTIPVGASLTFNSRMGWRVITQQGGTPDLRAGWVQEFRADGTWYKPSGCRFFMIDVVGAGGSGGGGEGGAAGSIRMGGGGGGGGCRVRRVFLASDLPASVAITVAAQTTGGAGNAGAAGTVGNQGGNSSFGSYLIGYGGGGGSGGGTSGASAGASGAGGGGTGAGGNASGAVYGINGPAMLATATTSSAVSDWRGSMQGTASFLGGAGGVGVGSAGGQGNSALASFFSGSGGAAGAGINASNAAAAGGSPSMCGQFGTTGAISPVGGRGNSGLSNAGYMGGGGGGGGSLYLANGNPIGGAGGDGGYPGGGGGGGGAASTGSGTATGGTGGKGGGGMVRVMGW